MESLSWMTNTLLQQFVAESKQDFKAKFKATLHFELSLKQSTYEINAKYLTRKLLQKHLKILTGRIKISIITSSTNIMHKKI